MREGSVTLAILAGGRGRRLGGVPKGLIVVDGETVIARVLKLRSKVDEVLLVTSDARPYASLGLETVADELPGRGAPGGVYSALARARTEWVCAVACDMPSVSPAVLQSLLAHRAADVDALCFEVGGRVEPLLALYRTEVAPRWRAQLERGEPSLRALLGLVRTRVLPEEVLRGVDPDLRSVQNLNLLDDLRRLGASLPDSRG